MNYRHNNHIHKFTPTYCENIRYIGICELLQIQLYIYIFLCIFSALAPLVLRGACPQCTPQETKQIQRTLSYVQRNFPQQWAKIVRQYSG